MSIWRWADWLEPLDEQARVTLGEGGTPLVRSRSIGPRIGLSNLWFKLESCNPTGSFKDRFAVTAVSHMLAAGRRLCVATSSGNTGAALAAYCAAAGIVCRIAIVETAPAEKLRQMLAYGAELYRIRGFGLDPAVTNRTFAALERRAGRPDAQLQISAFRYSPLGMNGVQAISWELAEQMGEAPDHIFTCAGGGGLTVAVARGCDLLVAQGRWQAAPRVHCVQPEGNATIAGPLTRGETGAVDVRCATAVSGLQVPTVIDGHQAVAACRATGGAGHLVTDAWTWEVQARLAREEGIFSEPAGAVPLAGLLQARARGEIESEARIVCLVTGSGFKDSVSADRMAAGAVCPLIDDQELVRRLEA